MLTFSSGDIVTVDNPAQIAVSGSLSANGTTFNYNGGSANLNFTSTGLISGANNIFNLPVIVPYTDVPSLAGNTSFDQVEISAATLSTGTLALNLLGTNATNFSYQFPNGFTVGSGATLAVGPNVPGLTLGQTLSDAGALTFSSGDIVTVDNPAKLPSAEAFPPTARLSTTTAAAQTSISPPPVSSVAPTTSSTYPSSSPIPTSRPSPEIPASIRSRSAPPLFPRVPSRSTSSAPTPPTSVINSPTASPSAPALLSPSGPTCRGSRWDRR